jgi:preprotein translocase subunit SecB
MPKADSIRCSFPKRLKTMADPDPRADGANPPQGEADAPEFSLQSVYLKDCSFEAPKGPRIDGSWNPQINLDLNTAAESVSPEIREVVLTVSVTAKNGDSTAFLVEVKQAGIFGVRNLSDEDYRRAVASIAPSVLFPYARAMVSHLVAQGGFPQMLLPPVNFDVLYARSLAESQGAQAPLNS